MKLSNKCYLLLQKIPEGKVTTYKALAAALGTKSSRAIGQIMKKNPKPYVWPCHRVVMSDGKLGGYVFGKDKKIELLQSEGVTVTKGKITDFKDKFILISAH